MKPLDVNATGDEHAPSGPAGTSDSETTGLPWLDTWHGVYAFVFGCFVVWVGLLIALTVIFS
jgi:hypothetical protein